MEDEKFMISNGKRRHVTATCTSCLDNSHKKCRECGCKICSGKQDEHNLLLCDECNYAYHLSCLDPPLTMIPKEDYWYCPECKNDENEIVKVCVYLLLIIIFISFIITVLVYFRQGTN